MSRVVQVVCPACKRALRVPADWAEQPLRCKHCGRQILLKSKKKGTPPAPARSVPDVLPVAAADEVVPTVVPAEDAPTFRVTVRKRRRSVGAPLAVLAIGVFLIGLAVVTIHLVDRTLLAGLFPVATWLERLRAPAPAPSVSVNPASAEMPRRLLAIGVSHYLYANPINPGAAAAGETRNKDNSEGRGRNIHTLVESLARAFAIPASQVVELSDSAPASIARAPLRSVIEQTVTAFLDGSRPQDRILILFVGHAVEIEGAPYLAPIDGDLTDKETLIALSWLYEALDRCRARQKVLVVDVCRFDPERGFERPSGGKMGEKLDAALKNPPDGVQVWSACVAGQYSYEFDHIFLNNGVFLDQLATAVGPDQRFRVDLGKQGVEESLPIDRVAHFVGLRTQHGVQKDQYARQTPRLSGREKPLSQPLDAAAAPPPESVVITPATLADGEPLASPASIASILKSTDGAIPAVRLARRDLQPLDARLLPPFAARALRPYEGSGAPIEPDENAGETPEKAPSLRAAIQRTTRVLRQQAEDQNLFLTFLLVNNAEVKQRILEDQRTPARILLQLTDALEDMKQAATKRDQGSTPRDRADFDYVLARLSARLAFFHEYNLMLAKVRKDELPELGPLQKGWRLTRRERLNTKEAREHAAEAKKASDRLIRENPGTPWEVLGRRERATFLGLEWQPTSFGD